MIRGSMFAAAIAFASVPASLTAQGIATPVPPPAWQLCPQAESSCVAPALRREFRGVWVASVRNLDWPSHAGLPPALAKAELIALLDRAAAVGLNAVLLQVRPAGDALYESKIEPWSEYLTGKQGMAPIPLWDPLEFAVREAHARGLELHAWVNPYRAKEPSAKGPLAASHIAKRHPELVKKYGTQLWMDPGEPAVQAHTLRVILDIVRRYDIDGLHLDDYFYPYPERRSNGSIDFPDERSWQAYRKRGGTRARDDWRRANVDELIEKMHAEIAKEKPWVKFGISPFQLWRPGYPSSITTGLDAYATLFADSRKWFVNGWVDYYSPQLYRRIDEDRSYGILLKWWAEQNVQHRHLWPGLYTSGVRTGNATEWRSSEIVGQVLATRDFSGVTGNVHFSMEAFLTNRDSVGTALHRALYAAPALVPASPWMMSGAPEAPLIAVRRTLDGDVLTVTSGSPVAPVSPRWWVVQLRAGDDWETFVLDGNSKAFALTGPLRPRAVAPAVVAVTAIDRVGNASAPTALRLR